MTGSAPKPGAEGGPGRRLAGRTAVVTGAGGAIGLAAARRLAAEGAHVVCTDLDEAAGRAAAKAAGGLFVPADLTDPYLVEALFDEAYETFGSVDVAFNNPGTAPSPEDDSILTTGPDTWRRVQEAELTSVYLCCRAALPYMRRHGRGSIINAAGLGAVAGPAGAQISRTAARGGVLALSRALGLQFAREGIRVNALLPGPVGSPPGRSARPEDIAAAVAFLAGDDAAAVTATEFLVDAVTAGG
ncbi:SDR family oxidoreductase [Kitasatospora sp. NBC_01560]